MATKSLSLVADDYFYNLNPLAKRIGDDVKATKDAYEELWNTLSFKEKNQAIDESLIQPEVALKYTLKNVSPSGDLPDFYPKLKIQTGLKYIIDETGSTLKWRDEHSAPFSFLTRSQMNLNVSGHSEISISKGSDFDPGSPRFTSPIKFEGKHFENPSSDYQSPESYPDSVFKQIDNNRLNNCNENSGNIFTKLINKTSLLKINNSSPDDEKESLVPQRNVVIRNGHKMNNSANKNQMNINLINAKSKSEDSNELTALVETPSSYNSFQSSQTNQDDGIPKTGFEFLDNW